MREVSLKEHLEAQIKWVDRYFEGKVQESKDSIKIALDTLNKRLEGMNEFRDTLKDQAARLATKEDIKSLDTRLKMLELKDARIAGMAAIVALVVSALVAFVTKMF